MVTKKYVLKPVEVEAVEVTPDNLEELITMLLSGERVMDVSCIVDFDRIEELYLTKEIGHRLLGYYLTKNEEGVWYAIAPQVFLARYSLLAEIQPLNVGDKVKHITHGTPGVILSDLGNGLKEVEFTDCKKQEVSVAALQDSMLVRQIDEE